MSYGKASSVMPQMLMAPLYTLVLGYALLGVLLSLFAPHIAKEDNGFVMFAV